MCGVVAVRAIGVEMLGNYDSDAFDSGRSFGVRTNTVAALALGSTFALRVGAPISTGRPRP
jgi:hypothetical protein